MVPEFERPVPITEPSEDRRADVVELGVPRRWPYRDLILAGALVVAAMFAVIGEPPPSPPEPPPRPSPTVPRQQTPPLSVEFPPITLDLPGEVRFFDQEPTGYGVILSFDCASGDRACTGHLATSEDVQDPNTDWVRRSFPSDALPDGTPAPLVLGPGVLLLEAYVERTPRRWHSRDGGRNWRRVPSGPVPTVPDTEAGRLTLEPLDRYPSDQCGQRLVSVYRRDTGRLAGLRQQPSLRACTVTPFPDAAGRIWVAGTDPRSGGAAVAMSPNSGRGWSHTRLPGVEAAWYVSISYAGFDVYATAYGRPRDRPYTAIFRYAGSGWTPVWRSTGNEPENMGTPTVCPAGLLLSAWGPSNTPEDVRLLFSRDSGRTWYLAEKLAALNATAVSSHSSSAWYGWYDSDPPRPVYSRDCRTWRGVPVG